MARAVSGGEGDGGRIVRNEPALFGIEFPNENPVECQVARKHVATCRIGFDHMRVGMVVPANGKTSGGGAGGVLRTHHALILDHVSGSAQFAVGADREHGHRPPLIVGH